MEREQALERIRKLMNLAADGSASEGEVNNAMKFARRMMDKFSIEEGELLKKDDRALRAEVVERDGYSRMNKLDDFDQSLAWVPSHICDVRFFLRKRWVTDTIKGGKHKGQKRRQLRQFVVFYGLDRDVAIAHELYQQLMVTMRAMARFRYGAKWSLQHASYCRGFVYRLIDRSQQLQQASSQPDASAGAIVLRKQVMLDQYEATLSLTTERSGRTRTDADAYRSGRSDADNVHLGTDGIGNGNSGGTPRRLK